MRPFLLFQRLYLRSSLVGSKATSTPEVMHGTQKAHPLLQQPREQKNEFLNETFLKHIHVLEAKHSSLLPTTQKKLNI